MNFFVLYQNFTVFDFFRYGIISTWQKEEALLKFWIEALDSNLRAESELDKNIDSEEEAKDVSAETNKLKKTTRK